MYTDGCKRLEIRLIGGPENGKILYDMDHTCIPTLYAIHKDSKEKYIKLPNQIGSIAYFIHESLRCNASYAKLKQPIQFG